MLREILNVFLDELNKHQKKDVTNNNRTMQIVEEIGELEIKLAKAMADAERWGDLTDSSDWRTVEVNRIKRVIESKHRLLETLKRF